MLRKLTFALTLLVLIPALLFAQDGKLRGTATDRETGEPLVGANILLDGTTLGASTDLNGEYVIVSVPPGTYTIKASYIGYSTYTISNVRVLSGLTTTQDFQLASSAIQVEAVEVVAERPLIQKNTTNTVRVATQEDIKNLPIRGVANIVSLSAGVVNQGGTLYVRGGRSSEVGYFVDGVNITNPYYQSQSQPLIQEALEEIQLQTGGYTAEFGNANSGIVRTTSRTGGTRLNFSLDYRTDDFAKPGDTFLGTTSRGYRNVVATVGGPVLNGIRFFVAGQNNYVRNSQAIFIEPFRFEGLTEDGLEGDPNIGRLLPALDTTQSGIVEYKRNNVPKNWNDAYSFNGNVLFDLDQLAGIPLKFRVLGTYGFANNTGAGGWPGNLRNYFRPEDSHYTNETTNWMVGGRLTHLLSSTTFYEIGVSYQTRFAESFDARFPKGSFNDWLQLADSAQYAAKGLPTSEWQGRYTGPFLYSTIYDFWFNNPQVPNNGYFKNEQSGLGVTLDLTSQVTSNWEIKAGGALDSWTTSVYNFNNVVSLVTFLDPNRDGVLDPSEATFGNEYEKRARYLDRGNIVTWGYTYLGEKTDGYTLDGSTATLDAPYEPLNASAYVQTKYEYKDLILNLGVRYEYYSPKFKAATSLPNPVTGELDYTEIAYIDSLGLIDETQLVETDPVSYVLPRISFSFPVTDMTVFYAQYGKFAQMPRLDTYYQSSRGFSRAVSPNDRSPYGGGVGFEVLPERTTLFEAGVRQILADNLAFTVTGFYRDTRQLIQIRPYENSQGQRLFTSYQNRDFGTIKGVELTLDLRRVNRLSARVNYTLSDAKGTGSSANSGGVTVSDETRARLPEFIVRMPFNQTHTGTALIDYRFAKGDGGPVLEGMGLNAILSFNSGHNWTKLEEPANLGQANPWNVGVRAYIDRRTSKPEEPTAASTTPWVFTVDLNWNKVFYIGDFNLELYVNVLNLLNTKSVVNVYPTTGAAQDDGWLKSPFADTYKALPNYTAFYEAVNLQNRFYAMQSFGEVYGPPREIRVGLRLEY